MDKIKLDILGLSSSQSQSGSFALVLGEHHGNRRLPIIIGMFEAQAIAIEIEKIVPNRPMTHDLFKSIGNAFNFTVEEIIISELREGVFFAKIVCNDGLKNEEIDARPSDAIAIGLRFNAPIYTNETILKEAGIILTDEEEEGSEAASAAEDTAAPSEVKSEQPVEAPKQEASPSSPSSESHNPLKAYSLSKLNDLLDKAIRDEDYEKAAEIRDEINKRE
ncbi:bifunctional nuclease family protein [Persicobacter psychrovividus]|uniref:BFN domain-containing protein n=1 Tax=Persicobacter psychrovividus TaxID=387638 RepID=A0ABN6L771_9BACT|nr:hypothetical protein PEPS_13350 [Persicobacter psychrovividus]